MIESSEYALRIRRRHRPFNARLAEMFSGSRSFITMDFKIRRAVAADCPAIMELVQELAAYERAPDAVTVSLQHFEESGFGPAPVWWAFVACVPAQEEEAAAAQRIAENLSAATVQDPLLMQIMEEASGKVAPAGTEQEVLNLNPEAPLPSIEPIIQLPDAVVPIVPEAIIQMLPASQAPFGRIIGFALYYIRYSTWKGQCMYLEDVIVTEAWRGKGAGTALMDALIGEARAAGLRGISWQVLDWNRPAKAFYERYGVRFDNEWVNAAIDIYSGS